MNIVDFLILQVDTILSKGAALLLLFYISVTIGFSICISMYWGILFPVIDMGFLS